MIESSRGRHGFSMYYVINYQLLLLIIIVLRLVLDASCFFLFFPPDKFLLYRRTGGKFLAHYRPCGVPKRLAKTLLQIPSKETKFKISEGCAFEEGDDDAANAASDKLDVTVAITWAANPSSDFSSASLTLSLV